MPTKNPLLIFRNEINNIDKKIVKLLAERKNLVLKIAQSKIENNQAIRDIEREKKMLQELIFLGKKHYLKPDYITQLFQLIIEESVLTQKKLLEKFCNNHKLIPTRIAFLGPEGSYSHIAACEYADRKFQKYMKNECLTFEEVILSVENNQSDYAVLPIENSCSGAINEVLNLLKNTNLFIVGEINIFINHCLLAIENVKLHKIKKVYSHPQPFEQCSNFIKQFPEWKIKYTKSTAHGMKKIAKYNEITNAVLGSEIGSKIYGLKILRKNVSNQEKNITRFIILHRNSINILEQIPTKTTLMFSTEQKSEDFTKVLSILQEKKLIMKKLSTQTVYKNPREEMFYIDIEANLSSPLMQDVLKKIENNTKFIKILGFYPSENIVPITP